MDIKTLNRISKLGGPKTIEDIKKLCDYLKIENYKINKDLTVDVEDSVYLYQLGLERIPLKFGKTAGSFFCHFNKLTSLEGCPKEVGGAFYCHNNKLTSLEGAPERVFVTFFCYGNKVKFTEDDVRKVCYVKGKIHT